MRSAFLGLLACVLPLAACSTGGEEDRSSEVLLAETHQISFIAGRARFPEAYPIKPAKYALQGLLILQKDGNYRIAEPGFRTSDPFRYSLSELGELLIFVRRSGRSSLRLSGTYDLDGDTFFFAKRLLDLPVPSQSVLSLYCGVKELESEADLVDDWSVFGTTLVFDDSQAKATPDRIGRAFGGGFTIEKDANDELVLKNGSWKDSSPIVVTVTGGAETRGKGGVLLDLSLDGGLATGKRSYEGGVGAHVGVLTDTASGDGEVGILCLLRGMSTPADKARLVGTWRLGVYTIFNSTLEPGTDAAIGKLELSDDDSWRIVVVGASQQPFEYRGTYTIDTGGKLTFLETSRNQSWPAAVSADYRNLVIVDSTTDRVNPEVGVFFGIRELVSK
ncbi:MAG: hypothetical protein ACE5F1_04955 [Planctomycetota bacterium]